MIRKIILSYLCSGVIVSSGFAANVYTFFSHASGTFSLEVNQKSCIGTFSMTSPLWVSVEKLSSYCSSQERCPISVYQGENCREDGVVIGKGHTEIHTGNTFIEVFKPNYYFFTTGLYSVGLHPKSPPG